MLFNWNLESSKHEQTSTIFYTPWFSLLSCMFCPLELTHTEHKRVIGWCISHKKSIKARFHFIATAHYCLQAGQNNYTHVLKLTRVLALLRHDLIPIVFSSRITIVCFTLVINLIFDFNVLNMKYISCWTNTKTGYKKQTFDRQLKWYVQMFCLQMLLTSTYRIHKLVTAFNLSHLKSCEGPSGSSPIKTYYYKSIWIIKHLIWSIRN